MSKPLKSWPFTRAIGDAYRCRDYDAMRKVFADADQKVVQTISKKLFRESLTELLVIAIVEDDILAVDILLDNGVPPHGWDSTYCRGSTPFMAACIKGNRSVMIKLINASAEIFTEERPEHSDETDGSDLQSPVDWLIENEKLDLIDLVIEHYPFEPSPIYSNIFERISEIAKEMDKLAVINHVDNLCQIKANLQSALLGGARSKTSDS